MMEKGRFMGLPRARSVAPWASLLLCSSLAAQSDNPNQSEDSANRAIEETLVIGREIRNETEITEDTERLFSVAGAAADPLQSIYSLPGVVLSSGFNSSDPVIRGSAPQDNAYYIDLVPASYIFHVFGNSIFNKTLVHDFELYPAAFPSEYGNATGGVIDVSLREPRNQDFTTTFNWSLLITGITVESRVSERQAFYASYRRSLIDKFANEEDLSEEEEGFQVDALPVADDYQVKYSWELNDNNILSLVAAGASDELAATFGEGSNAVERDPDFAGPASIDQGFDSQGLVWHWYGDERQMTTVFTHIEDQQYFAYGGNQEQNFVANRYLARNKYSHRVADRHTLVAGATFEKVTYDIDIAAKIVSCSDFDPDCPTLNAELIRYQDELELAKQAFFLEDHVRLTASQTLTFGVHYSADDYLDESRWEPRGRWDFDINENWSTYIAAGQYSQLPALVEIIDVIGNPELKTVKADHFVWGLKQRFGDGWSWNADVYYKDLQDIVISETALDGDDTENYSNNASGNAYGAEFLLRKDISDKWYGWASVSYARTERTNDGTGETFSFEYDKPVQLNLVANYLLGERWMLGMKWNYQSGSRYTPIIELRPNSQQPDVIEPVYGEFNSERLPAYHRLDFRAEYTAPKSWGYWQFFIDVLNVYNRENVDGYDYAPNGVDLVETPPGFGEDVPVSESTGLGIFPSIGFEVQF